MDYEIRITPESHKLTRCWTILAVTTFTISSLYSAALFLNSINWTQETILSKTISQNIFAININFSTSIWFLSCIAILWAVSTIHNANKFDWLALLLTAIGALLISTSLFFSDSEIILNKHIPIIQNNYFLTSLAIFISGIIIATFSTLARLKTSQSDPILIKNISSILKMGIGYTSIIVLISIGCFYLAYEELKLVEQDYPLSDERYYNLFFWGGGHILQYAYIQAMIIIWIIIAAASGIDLQIKRGLLFFIFIAYTLSTIPSGYIYAVSEMTSYAHKDFFTTHMRYAGGIPAIIIGILILKYYLFSKKMPSKETRHLRYSLNFSLLLTFLGIIINFTTYNLNTAPPHNQSLISGITIAMMGFIFYIMPIIGFAPIKSCLASISIILLSIGELLKATIFISHEILQLQIINLPELLTAGKALSLLGALIFISITYRSIFKQNSFNKTLVEK